MINNDDSMIKEIYNGPYLITSTAPVLANGSNTYNNTIIIPSGALESNPFENKE